jgi:DNA-binding transcriptional ArsR family regulator
MAVELMDGVEICRCVCCIPHYFYHILTYTLINCRFFGEIVSMWHEVSGVAMDDTDLAIIRELADGRIPFKELGRRLGLAEATVRNRVRRLREAGVLDISGRVDPDSLPDHSVVMVGVRVRDMNLVRKAEEFSNLRGGGVGVRGNRPFRSYGDGGSAQRLWYS